MPVLADLEVELDVTEGDAATLIDSDVTVTDAEQDWDGGTLVVAGMAPSDVVSLQPGATITLLLSQVFFNSILVGEIGTGPNGEFQVSFYASADNAAVEATVEALQFQALGDNPDFYRNLTVTLTDAAGNVSTVGEALFPANPDPFHGASLGSGSFIAVGDVDNDGDADVIVTVYGDGYHLLRNDGTASVPDYSLDDAALSVSGVVGNSAGMALYDIDGDGFLDLIVGRYGGTIQTFKGDGAFHFTELTGAANPFDGIQTYSFAAPGLADLDGDGFTDLVVARGSRRFDYFKGTAGGFVQQTGAANPLGAFHSYAGGVGSVSFADIDGDGDLDLISGGGEGNPSVFLNTGTASSPVFVVSPSVYTEGMLFGVHPTWVDIDGDGDIDQIEVSPQGDILLEILHPASPSIDVIVNTVDDPATVVNETPTGGADGPISVNVLSNDSDPDTTLQIVQATINGQPVAIDDITTLDDGTQFSIGSDGQIVLTPGSGAQALGRPGSGASNISLTYELVYTLAGSETGTATFTVNGVDDKDFLIGTNAAESIHAGVGNDTVQGLGGDDILHGEDNSDILYGGLGNDALWGDAGNDKLYGEDGRDYLTGGVGADYLYGGNDNDTLDGGADNDMLDGETGADRMTGGAGNDIYYVDDINDQTIEAANEGSDIVRASLSWVLGANIETLQLQGTGDLAGTGNGLANNLQGNDGANTLSGLAGVDTINGGGGADTIIGGTGNDLMTGGSGADTFVVLAESVYSSKAPAGKALEIDFVYDLIKAQGDRLDLSAIDADISTAGVDDAFRLATGGFTKHAGEMTLVYTASTNQTVLSLDVDGDGKADYQMKITGDVHLDSGGWIL